MKQVAALWALILLPRAWAHGGVIGYTINGQWYKGWAPYNTPTGQTSIERPWATYDPITDPTSSSISCNDDGQSSALQLTATVAAGSKITAYWNAVWPHPYGPMLTYLAKCPGTTCTGVSSNSLSWFKIDQSGLISGTVGNGQWGSGLMIQQNNSWTSTIPSTVPAGSYLIRFETIALHSMPAQFYPECAQLQITGSGNRAPTSSELVKLPGAYKLSDPGVTVNLYTQEASTQTQYIIPGPPLYGSGGTGTQPAPPPSSSTSSRPVSSSTSRPVSTPSPSPTAGTVAQYGQCGGIGWTGGTACISPFTCQKINDYYSQCL